LTAQSPPELTLSAQTADDAPLADVPADERRWSGRRSTVLAGTIISDSLSGSATCVVRDLSATGALIELRNSKTSVRDLPDQFALILLHDNSEVRCQIAWRQPTSIGVRFLGGFRALPVRSKPKLAAPTKRSWF
jgi:PilZ domain